MHIRLAHEFMEIPGLELRPHEAYVMPSMGLFGAGGGGPQEQCYMPASQSPQVPSKVVPSWVLYGHPKGKTHTKAKMNQTKPKGTTLEGSGFWHPMTMLRR